MFNGLDLNGLSKSSIASSFKQLLEPLQSNTSVLNTANKVYIQQGNQINAEFNAIATNDFYSSSETLNFENAVDSANTINNWVAEETHNLIENLISPDALSPTTKMVLVNCIYFNGLWDTPFESYETYPQQFYVSKSASNQIDFMHATVSYEHNLKKKLYL